MLRRMNISDIIPFGSPVLALVDEVRLRNASVTEYRIDISSPRLGKDRIVDVFASPLRQPVRFGGC
jgi:two-component system, NtrC family, nitrogen regulation sensor histidine kinase GlnL